MNYQTHDQSKSGQQLEQNYWIRRNVEAYKYLGDFESVKSSFEETISSRLNVDSTMS